MTDQAYAFPPLMPVALPVTGGNTAAFPAHRIFCIGKNYAAHAAEMGSDPTKPPVFFMKPASALVCTPADLAFPRGTSDLHYEGELVVALGPANETGTTTIFGYAAGCDLTKRDLQAVAKKNGAPWDAAKAFDQSAVIGPISPVADGTDISSAKLATKVNAETRQSSPLSAMTWGIDAILEVLSAHFTLLPGDLIFTGTPEGVGPLHAGDDVEITITGFAACRFSVKAPTPE